MNIRSPGSIIFAKIDNDSYLTELYENILFNYSVKLFALKKDFRLVNVEDALRFADLLSKSTHPREADRHKILSQEIAALLRYIYPDNSTIEHYLGSILSSTGNYIGKKNQAISYKSKDFLDCFYSEFMEDFMSIPAEPDNKFLYSQKTIYDRLDVQYLSYSGPTSMGKSFIMRMFIKKQVMDGSNLNFAIIVPTKALINEVSHKITSDLQGLIAGQNYKIVTSPGSLFLNSPHNFIFILTPERLLYLLICHPNISVDYLFIDEAHRISSADSRSTFYYKTVEMLSRNLKKTSAIFASPNIPNPEIYLKLLSRDIGKQNAIASKFSPVSQIKYFIDFPSKKVQFYNNFTKELSFLTDINPKTTINRILRYIGKDRKNLVYCASKAKAIEMAQDFATDLDEISDDKELIKLASEISSEIHGDCYLANLIRKGVAYHVGYLPASIRMRIEDLYKAEGSNLTTLFCTSTLVEGVNLPADNLFITSYYNGLSPLSEVDFANLLGRVGRIEYNLYGNVFLTRVEDTDRNQIAKFEEYLKNKVPEQRLSIASQLSNSQKQKIIECLMQGSMELLKHPKSQSNESYELMRKFAIILVRDIVKGSNSIVKYEFEEYLKNGVEEQIRMAFNNKKNIIDDDINISVDQSENLSQAIRKGLRYPAIDSKGFVSHQDLMEFLNRLCDIFKWERYEKGTLGKICKPYSEYRECNQAPRCYYCRKKEPRKQLSFYAVVLSKWIEGKGLSWIIKDAIEYKRSNPEKAIMLPDRSLIDYDYSLEHRNFVIAETLDIVENIILFRISNYFLKFSAEYKTIHGPDSLKQDWYEYVEYGTINELSIFFQRNGFLRETANYIKDNGYCIKNENGDYRIKRSILHCGKESILREINDHVFNAPELFID